MNKQKDTRGYKANLGNRGLLSSKRYGRISDKAKRDLYEKN